MNERITQILLMIPIMLISLTVHEYAHGRVAYARGDATARNLGRLSLNPLKHLDPIGALCMVLFGFGWAKPVPINSRNLRRPRSDMAIISVAGPISNLLLAFLGVFLYSLTFRLILSEILPWNSFVQMLCTFLWLFHYMNISLAVFNLIPIPPLDGSRIATMFLPPKYYWWLARYEQYIGIILMVVVFLGSFTGLISFVTSKISNSMFNLCSYIPLL